MKRIIHMHDAAGPRELGAKGYALACAQRAGFPVPPFLAIPPAVCAAARTSAGAFEFPQALRHELAASLTELCPNGELAAVRSSAVDEDGARCSFAGQLQSFLFVRADEVAARIVDVWRSAYAEQVTAYRARHGVRQAPRPPAVLVQRMVNASTAGVAFSADPVSGRRGTSVVAAVHGVADQLVSGARNADTWHVDRAGNIVRRVVAGPQACLDDGKLREVVQLARRCAHHMGRPQDIEWAIADGKLHLIQSRPITSLCAHPDPDGALAIWDSSNIGESYGGVTTPLTFSYIRKAYQHVYRQLCAIGGVDRAVIADHDDVFGRMLGLVAGRVHYNLLGWYRLLALIPGFSHNRRFLDEMLGIRVETAAEILSRLQPQGQHAGGRARSAWQCLTLLRNYLTVERRNGRFRRRLDAALAPAQPALEEMRADELADYFRALERALLTKWDAPLVNDFFAMIFHGLLRRLIERWIGPAQRGLANDLLSGEPGIISVEPARRMRAMAAIAANDRELAALLCHGRLEDILRQAPANAAFHAAYCAYLERFGDRCLEELKLESTTLVDDPLPLLRTVGRLAVGAGRAVPAGVANPRYAAERRVREILGRNPLKLLVFGWVLRNARARMRDRENLRFERTRVFGRVRRIFIEIGKRLWALELLQSPRDIFWLELDEILGFIDGTATCTNLTGLAALRQAEFARYRGGETPDRRFETRGIVSHGNRFRSASTTAAAESGDARSATGCCPGTVRGPARVIRSPANAAIHPGEILIAERTDPGWVMLFASAAGLVIEHGSLLSHAAIVARELGIPAVIGVTGACRWLADGDIVELDGANGAVRRLDQHACGVAMRSSA
jgi:phosphohistidine swiveling domain-containing protein